MYKIIIRSLATGRQIRKRFYESEAHFKKQYNRWATPQHKVFYIVEAYFDLWQATPTLKSWLQQIPKDLRNGYFEHEQIHELLLPPDALLLYLLSLRCP